MHIPTGKHIPMNVEYLPKCECMPKKKKKKNQSKAR